MEKVEINEDQLVLEALLAKLRQNEPSSKIYIASGEKALGILKRISLNFGSIEDTVELYFYRLKCRGHLDIIRFCETRILEILGKGNINRGQLIHCNWYGYLHSGFRIFADDVIEKIKEKANQILAAA